MLDDIADADDPGQLAVAQHRHVAHAMVRHQVHRAIDGVVRGHGDHAMVHNVLHLHRPGCLAVARKCVNNFTFGHQTENGVPPRHHESADILGEEPVRSTFDAGFRSYCGDLATLPPQNAVDGHGVLPSCGLAADLVDW